jgi:outer membrane protein TolC
MFRLVRFSLALGATLAMSAVCAEASLTLEQARRLALERQPSMQPLELGAVTTAWLSAWSAARTAALVRALQAEYRRGVQAATVAVAGGRGTLGDVYAARQLVNQSQDRLLELALQSERSAAELFHWTGAPDAAIAAVPPSWREPPPLAEMLARLEAHPRSSTSRAELQATYAEWRRSGERLANFDAHILPDAQARVEALAVGYAAGRSELGSLLEARRGLYESRVQRIAVEVAQARARAALEQFERTHGRP